MITVKYVAKEATQLFYGINEEVTYQPLRWDEDKVQINREFAGIRAITLVNFRQYRFNAAQYKELHGRLTGDSHQGHQGYAFEDLDHAENTHSRVIPEDMEYQPKIKPKQAIPERGARVTRAQSDILAKRKAQEIKEERQQIEARKRQKTNP